MLYIDALNHIIDDGIEAARFDYCKPSDKLKRDGAVKGFNECRSLSAAQLGDLLVRANKDACEAHAKEKEDYWYWRCRAAEIGWVCNVISAILLNEGYETITTPTVRGALKAAEIVGIGEAAGALLDGKPHGEMPG